MFVLGACEQFEGHFVGYCEESLLLVVEVHIANINGLKELVKQLDLGEFRVRARILVLRPSENPVNCIFAHRSQALSHSCSLQDFTYSLQNLLNEA